MPHNRGSAEIITTLLQNTVFDDGMTTHALRLATMTRRVCTRLIFFFLIFFLFVKLPSVVEY
jgi:hypothetical protein